MKMIHSMIRVQNLENSIQFYEQVLNFQVKERFDFDDFTLVYLGDSSSHFELELTHNHGNTEAYDLGTGYGHLAVSTENLAQAFEQAQTYGVQPTPIKEFFRDGNLMAKFFFVKDPDGYKIEVLQQHGRYI